MLTGNLIDFILLLLNIWAAKAIYDLIFKVKLAKSSEKPSEASMPTIALEMAHLARQHGWVFEPGDVFNLYETKPSESQKQILRTYFVNGQTRGPAIAQHIAEDFKAGTLVPIVIVRNKDDAENKKELLFGIDFKELETNYKNFFEYFPEYRKHNPASN